MFTHRQTAPGIRWCPTSHPVWKFEIDHGAAFENFSDADCLILERAFAQGNTLEPLQQASRPWVFDLCEMTQTNAATGSTRRIQRVLQREGLDFVYCRDNGVRGDFYVAYVSHVR